MDFFFKILFSPRWTRILTCLFHARFRFFRFVWNYPATFHLDGSCSIIVAGMNGKRLERKEGGYSAQWARDYRKEVTPMKIVHPVNFYSFPLFCFPPARACLVDVVLCRVLIPHRYNIHPLLLTLFFWGGRGGRGYSVSFTWKPNI